MRKTVAATTALDTEELRQAGLYLAHLIRCGLAGEQAAALPAGATWESVHALAARSSVEGVSWFGVKTRPDLPHDLRERWEGEANRTLFRRLSFDMERERIISAMDECGLSHLPLKGVLVADYYPRPEMRSMADNDILYGFVEPFADGGFAVRGTTERERERTVCEATTAMAQIMDGLGYRAESLGRGNHDSFYKEPLFNFEMHRQLMSASSPLCAYYANPWQRAVPVGSAGPDDSAGWRAERRPISFRFSDEDEYVYLLAHAFKHFDASGCGIRFVVDLRVFLDRKGARMDWAYVHGELEALGLSAFEAAARKLADAAFGMPKAGEPGVGGAGELDDDDRQLLWYLLGCGTYGSLQARVEREVARCAKEGGAPRRRYMLRRVFLDEDRMREAYPTFYRHRALRPLLPLYRICRGLLVHPAQLVRELKILRRL